MAIDDRLHYTLPQSAEQSRVSSDMLERWFRNDQLPGLKHAHVPDTSSISGNHEFMGCAPRTDWTLMSASEHFVQFYDTDTFLVDSVADFIASGLVAGDAVIVVTTPAHQQGFDERLGRSGLDVSTAIASGQYVVLDAAETLATFMVDGMPDAGRFHTVFSGIISEAASRNRPVRIFGEMVSLLALDGNHAATVRVEELWNGLQRTCAFSLFCAYAMDQFDGQSQAHFLAHVCEQHSSVIPAESYSALPNEDARLRAISALQQKASWLEAEIAERKRVEDRLRFALESERAARQETETALGLRDDFLSIAAHELRTPLAVLSGHAQLTARKLRRGGDLNPEQILPGLQAVSGQAEKLTLLLDQLLDISRLDAGNLALNRKAIDLVAMLQRLVSDFRVLSDCHTFTLSVPESLTVQVDALRLEQVLANFLDNAMKYSPAGSTVEVQFAALQDATVELSVRDHGPGIPDEKRGDLFERFCQAPSNGYGAGLGLGLYISRQIVELHGGEIRAEFPADGGSRFVVTLPTG